MAAGDTRKVLLENTDGEYLIPYTEVASSNTVGRVKPDGTSTVVDANGVISVTGKQDTLVSGTNIKTINNTSLLGSGDVTVQAVISDLSTIRSGASAGATAVQPADLATVATTGAYSDLSGTPTIPTVDQSYSGTSTNAQSGVAVKSAIDSAISSVYKPGGSVAFANLPTLGSTYEGYVYNVTDAFTTTSDFVEGAGKSYPAGTNVICINTATSGTAVYKWDALTGMVDLSGKQDTLVSGTNIKTINSTSLLGSGDIAVQAVISDLSTIRSGAEAGATAVQPADLATVATSGAYSDLSGTPTIPTVNNATLTIQANGTNVATFTANASSDVTANISIPDSATWGNITGTLSNQTDLNTALGNKQNANTAVTHTASTAVGSATQPVYIASNGTATATTYALNKTVPSDAVFTDTTYSVFTGANGTNAGTAGLVKAPAATDNTKFLKGDGTWSDVAAGATSWGNISGTLSNQTDLQNALNAKADDNAVMKLSGNQTASGDKTFTGMIKGEAGSNTNHAVNLGHASHDYMDFYEYGAVWNFYKSRSNTNTLVAKITENYMQIPTPTEDTTSSVQADTVGARNTKLANYVPTSSLATCHVVIDSYTNGYNWYRIYDDGWCEQGGLTAVGTSATITFLVTMANTNYTALTARTMTTTVSSDSGGRSGGTIELSGYSITGMKISQVNVANTYTAWFVCGMKG